MIYKVEVTETLQRVIEVDADSMSEAIELVEFCTNDGSIELTAEDFVSREFKVLED